MLFLLKRCAHVVLSMTPVKMCETQYSHCDLASSYYLSNNFRIQPPLLFSCCFWSVPLFFAGFFFSLVFRLVGWRKACDFYSTQFVYPKPVKLVINSGLEVDELELVMEILDSLWDSIMCMDNEMKNEIMKYKVELVHNGQKHGFD